MGQVIRIDEARIKGHPGEMVRGTAEEVPNAMLDAEADRYCGESRYERSEARQDRRAGNHERVLQTEAGEAQLKLRRRIFATAIIERYRRACSLEKAPVELSLAGVSPRRVETIKLLGQGFPRFQARFSMP
jgi:transposase-like protein